MKELQEIELWQSESPSASLTTRLSLQASLSFVAG